MLIDSHCHLDFPELAGDEAGVLARARTAGVAGMLTIGTRLDQFERVRAIAERHDNVWCSVGVHPHEAKEEGQRTPDRLIEATRHPKVVGIGETGLDFYYEHSPREEQVESFRAHIAAARQTGLPLIVHTRDADARDRRHPRGGVRQGRLPRADPLLQFRPRGGAARIGARPLHFHLGHRHLQGGRGTARRSCVTSRSTGCWWRPTAPYLAPVPKRGKTNEPAFVAHTAAKVAELKGIGIAELEAATTDNFFRLFAKAERQRCG